MIEMLSMASLNEKLFLLGWLVGVLTGFIWVKLGDTEPTIGKGRWR